MALEVLCAIAHLDLPPAHGHIARTTNLLERLFGEERRRTKVAPTLWGKRPCSSSPTPPFYSRRSQINDFERGQLQLLAEQIKQQRQQENQPAAEEALNPEGSLQKRPDLTSPTAEQSPRHSPTDFGRCRVHRIGS